MPETHEPDFCKPHEGCVKERVGQAAEPINEEVQHSAIVAARPDLARPDLRASALGLLLNLGLPKRPHLRVVASYTRIISLQRAGQEANEHVVDLAFRHRLPPVGVLRHRGTKLLINHESILQ